MLTQDQRVIQVHSRAGDLWRKGFFSAGAIELAGPPLGLEVEAIYAAADPAA